MSASEQGDKGTPEEAVAAYEQFRSHARPVTPEEDAALGLAIELSEAEFRAFVENNRTTRMAEALPGQLRETVLNDLAHVMRLAAGLQESWRAESEPADLLSSARAIRDAASSLARTIESLWPHKPPSDYGSVLQEPDSPHLPHGD